MNQKKISVRTSAPAEFEGTDGDFLFVAIDGFVYLYYRYNKEWYRTLMQKVSN